MKIVIGIPAFNEEKNIASLIIKLKRLSYDVIVVNDGSNDTTSDIAKSLGVIVIDHNKNKGYGAAISSLFQKAKELDYDILVTFDADGQHQTTDIQRVLEPILNNKADIVIGSRFLEKTSNIPKYRKFGIQTITKLSNVTTKNKIVDSQSGFRAYNKKVLNEITPVENGMGVSTEILIKANKKDIKIHEISITVLYEGETSTHNPALHGISVIISTMKFISIEHPIKFYGLPGIIFLTIGLFFIVWTIQSFGETRQIITNVSLIGIGSTLLGVLLCTTSIILYSIVSVVREKR